MPFGYVQFPLGLLGRGARLRSAGFVMVRVGSLGSTKGLSGSFVLAWVHYRRVHSRSRGFTRARLGIAGFIPFRVGSLGRAYRSPGSFEFAWVHSCAYNYVLRQFAL